MKTTNKTINAKETFIINYPLSILNLIKKNFTFYFLLLLFTFCFSISSALALCNPLSKVFDMGGFAITGLPTTNATETTQIITKSYVDGLYTNGPDGVLNNNDDLKYKEVLSYLSPPIGSPNLLSYNMYYKSGNIMNNVNYGETDFIPTNVKNVTNTTYKQEHNCFQSPYSQADDTTSNLNYNTIRRVGSAISHINTTFYHSNHKPWSTSMLTTPPNSPRNAFFVTPNIMTDVNTPQTDMVCHSRLNHAQYSNFNAGFREARNQLCRPPQTGVLNGLNLLRYNYANSQYYLCNGVNIWQNYYSGQPLFPIINWRHQSIMLSSGILDKTDLISTTRGFTMYTPPMFDSFPAAQEPPDQAFMLGSVFYIEHPSTTKLPNHYTISFTYFYQHPTVTRKLWYQNTDLMTSNLNYTYNNTNYDRFNELASYPMMFLYYGKSVNDAFGSSNTLPNDYNGIYKSDNVMLASNFKGFFLSQGTETGGGTTKPTYNPLSNKHFWYAGNATTRPEWLTHYVPNTTTYSNVMSFLVGTFGYPTKVFAVPENASLSYSKPYNLKAQFSLLSTDGTTNQYLMAIYLDNEFIMSSKFSMPVNKPSLGVIFDTSNSGIAFYGIQTLFTDSHNTTAAAIGSYIFEIRNFMISRGIK